MEKLKLAICDKEEEFARKMYEYVVLTEKDTYDVSLFTEENAIRDFLSESYVDILLISEDFDTGTLNLKNAGSIIRLSEEASRVMEPGNIYKYRKRDEILKDLAEKYLESGNRKPVLTFGKGLKVIGVYSPNKRCFQTTFSIAYGQMLAKEHKVLYLNFEAFSGFDNMLMRSGRLNLMDLMYFLECSEDDFFMRLKSMVEKIGDLDYVPPAKSFVEYKDVQYENWLKLIEAIDEKTDYEYLIMDMSEQVMGLFDILRLCEKVFTLTDEGRVAEAKMSQYITLLKESAYSDILDKTERLRIPRFYDIPGEFELLPYGELAAFIKKTCR